MFLKKMMAVATASVFLFGTLPVEAGTFGKSSSSSSSSSRSSSFSGSSSRSSSFGSPSSSISSSSTRSGGISGGTSLGMSRSSVANNVKSGNYTAPANGTTVAGSNPGGSSYNNSSNYNNRSYNGGYANNGGYNNGYNNNYNGGYQQPNQGHSTGTVVGAAAAGALAGYALGNHNNNGNTTVVVPNGGGYNNGPAYNNGGAPVVVDNNGNYVNGVPNNGVYTSHSSGGFGSFIWTLLKIVIGLALLFFIVRFLMGLFNRSNSGVSSFSPTPSPVFNNKTPEDEIRDMKEDFFVQFQQNNRPSGMDYIRQQSTPVFFNAVEDFVRAQDENRTVKVRQIDAELVDLVQEGSRYIASVRYNAVVAEGTSGNMTDNQVKELWNFVYENNRWKLAGIDQL